MKTKQRIHWTTHCLGIAGFLGVGVALRSLVLQDTDHHLIVVFDLVIGLTELGMALFYLHSKDGKARER